ncbi:MAG: glycine cleavage system aminomethyltransferase GcvT, partial [Gemmatimonadetes bacterium]|nr:glycine cleavage system aminomethyltransferase GcvT [Gemmatimonadota bacterium]
ALEKEMDFQGRTALLTRRQGSRRLLGLRIDGKGIPRPGYEVAQDDKIIGVVTSGTYSPSLQAGIALALVDLSLVDQLRQAAIIIRGKQVPAQFSELPFVVSRVKRRLRKRTVS